MKKINEDISITDPTLAQQYANAKQQLINKDQQINALNKQILRIQSEKIKVQAIIDQIEKNSASGNNQQQPQQQQQQQQQQQNKNKDLESAQKQLAAQVLMNQPTTESLTIGRLNMMNRINALNELAKTASAEEAPAMYREIRILSEAAGVKIEEDLNPFGALSFYKMTEEEGDGDPDNEQSVLYVEITDHDNRFLAKIFKPSSESDWVGKIIYGTSRTFERLAYKSDYEEDDIINFLTVNYDNVRVLSEKEFNEYTEDDIFYNED
jgi:hypothetical protein